MINNGYKSAIFFYILGVVVLLVMLLIYNNNSSLFALKNNGVYPTYFVAETNKVFIGKYANNSKLADAKGKKQFVSVKNRIPGAPHWQEIKYGDAFQGHILLYGNAFVDTTHITGILIIRLAVIYPSLVRLQLKQNNNVTGEAKHRLFITFDRKDYIIKGQLDNFKVRFQRDINGYAYRREMLRFRLPEEINKGNLHLLNPKAVYKCNKFQLSKNVVDLLIPEPFPRIGGIFMCSRVLYGRMNESEVPYLIQWFETYRYLGVKKMYFYNGSMQLSPNVSHLFNYYQNLKFIEIHQFSTPFSILLTKKQWRLAEYSATIMSEPAALNDCYNRYKNQYDYVINVDFDEIMMPARHSSYIDMMHDVVLNNPIVNGVPITQIPSFELPWAMFYNYHGKNQNVFEQTEYLYVDFRGKSITNTTACAVLMQHSCITPQSSFFISGSIALTHHYRKECKKEMFCNDNLKLMNREHNHVVEDRVQKQTLLVRKILGMI